MGWRRFLPLSLAASIAAALLFASTAPAAQHLMSIREVYSGTTSNSSYVMLQMYASGQNFVSGHSVTLYDASGSLLGTFTFSGNVPNGQNQRTILVGDDGVQTSFGLTPDLVNSAFNVPPGGGAACFGSFDCVAWGNFSGSSLSSPTGTPESSGGIPTGMAIRRSISGGTCTGQLDAADDTNNSDADFSPQTPHPRNNASAIEETSCSAPTGPNTTIGTKPPNRTNSTEAEFTFSATPATGASFECKLDTAAFASCTSPKTYSALDGDNAVTGTAHKFEVLAKNADGTDPTPATHSWTVDTVAPTMTITDEPDDPSHGGSAAFTYQANESVASTQCRLDKPEGTGTFESCPVGSKTYSSLSDGLHTFMVRATDLAGNQGAAAEYSWTVNNLLPDPTPPETTILSKPPNPSSSSSASFTYSSNEPGSIFECRLDGAGFAACPIAGITYVGLANGTHTFQVRARDPSGNLDESPAGYTFDVFVPAVAPPPLAPPPLAPPPLTSVLGPGTAFAAGVALIKGAKALLRVSCRGQQGARCKGVLRLAARIRIARSSRRTVRDLVIGSARYNLPTGGMPRVVRVPISGQGRRLVRRAGSRGLKVRLVGRGVKNRVLKLLHPAARKTRANRRSGGRGGAR